MNPFLPQLDVANCRRHGAPVVWAYLRLAACALLLTGPAGTAATEVAPKELVPVKMMAGFTPAAFLQSNRNDVEAAFRVLVDSIGRKRGFEVTVKAQFFPNNVSYRAAIAAGEVNFAVFDALTYVAESSGSDLAPVFFPATKGTVGRRYLLLVRRDSGLRSVDDLRGRSIVEFQPPTLSLGHTWLLNLLLTKSAGTPDKFFKSVEFANRPSTAVLPVFFGKRDVCLVDDLGFRLMEELNPQVGTRLVAVETSAPLVGAVICASKSNWDSPAFRPLLIKALAELGEEPAGRQLLSLFKIDQLVPFDEVHLEPARELWASYAKLRKESGP